MVQCIIWLAFMRMGSTMGKESTIDTGFTMGMRSTIGDQQVKVGMEKNMLMIMGKR